MVSPDQLANIADDMKAMKVQADADLYYDLLSDSLQWSDEIPPLGNHSPRDFWCLRLIFRYRTTLILQQPDQEFEEYWIGGKKLFPQWAGFHPTRCLPNREFVDLYEQRKSTGMRSLTGGE